MIGPPRRGRSLLRMPTAQSTRSTQSNCAIGMPVDSRRPARLHEVFPSRDRMDGWDNRSHDRGDTGERRHSRQSSHSRRNNAHARET
jgi:hypothetical protein